MLEGECQIGTHRLVAGDVHVATAGSWHESLTTRTGALVLVRGEYPHPSWPSAFHAIATASASLHSALIRWLGFERGLQVTAQSKRSMSLVPSSRFDSS